jgi:outer membrane protein OmpA-like peptidoglycan-associated protein
VGTDRSSRGRSGGRQPLRGARPPNSARRLSGEPLSRRGFLITGGAAAGALAIGGFVLGTQRLATADATALIVEKTTRSPGKLASEIRAALLDVAARGGGRLDPYAAGQSIRPLAAVDLTDVRQGETENDARLLAAEIGRRLDRMQAELGRVDVGPSGFDLVRVLQTLEAASQKVDRLQAWLQTTVLTSSSDPLLMTALSSADPQAAIDDLRPTSLHRLDLSRVEAHIVLVEPMGDDQPALSIRMQHWRADFFAGLLTDLGASVSDPIRSAVTAQAWPASSAVPAIVSKETPTPHPDPERDPTGQPPEAVDTAAFEPDSARLIDPAAVQPKITRMAERYREAGGRYSIACTGFCAAFGKPDGARALSASRAAVIGQLLVDAGVPGGDVSTAGEGFDLRADPTADPRSAAQRVVIMRFVARGSAPS